MIFRELPVPGACVVEPELHKDPRGFFARLWCREEFQARGLCGEFVQCSTSFNERAGTLRGMHYQAEPHGEVKLVRCTRGAIHDVILDLRPDSPHFKRWTAVELSAANRLTLYIPKGVAHGFQTLEPDTDVLYHISEFYHPESVRGVRWDDPAFGVKWPLQVSAISARDAGFRDFRC